MRHRLLPALLTSAWLLWQSPSAVLTRQPGQPGFAGPPPANAPWTVVGRFTDYRPCQVALHTRMATEMLTFDVTRQEYTLQIWQCLPEEAPAPPRGTFRRED